MADEGYTKAEVEAICARRVNAERERCAKIAEDRFRFDTDRYTSEKDWRQPYACNRVVRASMDIAAAIRHDKKL